MLALRPALVLVLTVLPSLACQSAGPPPPPPQAPVAVAPAAAPGAAPAPDPNAALAEKIDPLFAAYATGHVPGCAVGVYRAGEVVFAKGYGYADLEHDVPNTDTTVFDMASVSKQLTAAAILLLAQDGRVSLDDDVRKYLTEMPDYGKRITLRHLLHHTGGLRNIAILAAFSGRGQEDAVTNEEVLWLLSHQRGLNFPPGTRHEYSNSGYVLLSLVVERVTGAPFSSFVKARIFEPLGMTDSSIKQDHRRLIPHRAMGYERRPDGTFAISMSSEEYTGDSNVMTTLRDMAQWDANFYAPKVGGQALVDGLRTRGKLDDGTTLDYAMGLVIGESLGRPYEWHNGGVVGYRTMVARYPADRLTVAVFCNEASANPEKLSEEVAAVFLPKKGEGAEKTQAAAPEPPKAPLGIDAARLAGAYRDPVTQEIRVVEVKDGVIHMRLALEADPEARELFPIGPRLLAVKGAETTYTFEPAQGKLPAHLVRKAKGDPDETFVRFEPLTTVAPAKLEEYAGRYGSDEIAHDVSVFVKDGKLFAGLLGRKPALLKPLASDVFLLFAFGFSFERDARGKVKAVVIDTAFAHGLRYQKR